MSTRWPVRRADNLTTFVFRLSWNLGAWTSWKPQGLSRSVMELLYIYQNRVITTLYKEPLFSIELKPVRMYGTMRGGLHYQKLQLIIISPISYILNSTVHNTVYRHPPLHSSIQSLSLLVFLTIRGLVEAGWIRSDALRSVSMRESDQAVIRMDGQTDAMSSPVCGHSMHSTDYQQISLTSLFPCHKPTHLALATYIRTTCIKIASRCPSLRKWIKVSNVCSELSGSSTWMVRVRASRTAHRWQGSITCC